MRFLFGRRQEIHLGDKERIFLRFMVQAVGVDLTVDAFIGFGCSLDARLLIAVFMTMGRGRKKGLHEAASSADGFT